MARLRCIKVSLLKIETDEILLERIVSILEEIPIMRRSEEETKSSTRQLHEFSLTKGLEKIKIHVPLTELVKPPTYKKEIAELINLSQNVNVNDTVNLQEDKPVLVFGPLVEEVDSSTPLSTFLY